MERQYTIHQTEYLDEKGLKELWEKIKVYVAENSSNINPDDIEVDLSEYVTIEMLEEALSHMDLAPYATKEELAVALRGYARTDHVHSEYLTEHQDISGKSDVGHKHVLSDIEDFSEPDLTMYALKEELPNLDEYATQKYVTEAITNAQLGGGEGVDLSEYVKTEDMNTALATKADTEHTHSEYLTEHQDISGKADVEHTHTLSEVTDYVAPDLSNLATKDEIPSLTGYLRYEVVTAAPDTQEEGVLYIVTN
jgi:hypothetical protein